MSGGWGADWDRKAFGVVAGLVLVCTVALLLFSPGGEADVALAAQRRAREQAAAPQPERAAEMSVVESFAAPEPEREPVLEEALRVVHDDSRIADLVDDLRDDGIRFNGGKAMRELLDLPPGWIPELEAVLTSFDVQQRHFAAAVLRYRYLRHGGTPPDELLRVSVDAMDSRLQLESMCTVAQSPGSSSLRFLQVHTQAARDLLLRAIDSTDRQQRLFSAYLLARARVPERASRVAYLLVEHLRDNRIGGDALMATHGLYRLGELAVPVMSEARRYGDEQARKLIDLILLDLRDPPRNKQELWARKRMHGITSIYHDPAIEYSIDRSWVSTR